MTKKPINALRKKRNEIVAKRKTPAVSNHRKYARQSRPINAILNNLYQQELYGREWNQSHTRRNLIVYPLLKRANTTYDSTRILL